MSFRTNRLILMGEEYGMYIDFDGPMPVEHGPYLSLDIDLNIPDVESPDFDAIDYEFSLGRVMRDEGLTLPDVALQSIYQYLRHMNSTQASIQRYTMSGECGDSAVRAYSDTLDALNKIVNTEEHGEFIELFQRQVDRAIRDEDDEYWFEREESSI